MKRIFRSLPVFLLVLMFSFCTKKEKDEEKLFSLISSDHSQVFFRNDLKEDAEYNILNYLYFYNGGGVAVGDINNDGFTDLYFSSNQGENKLYLNKGNLKFEDITSKAGVASVQGWKTGVSMADVNGDGFLDIYVCKVGSFFKDKCRNELFINNKDNTFSEKAKDFNLDFQGLSTQAGFFDYDKDGDLDMFLLNHSVHSNRNYGDTSLRRFHDEFAGDRLYRNDGVKFTDVTYNSGIYSSSIDYGLGLALGDINQDGWADIYVSNDFHENDYLYYNNGDGTFTEGIEESTGHTSRFSMGNDLADVNNDGLPDLIVADMQPEEEKVIKVSEGAEPYDIYQFKLSFGYHPQYSRNTLQCNSGIKVPLLGSKTQGVLFNELGQLSGVSATDWSWATLFSDLDNDGLKDLLITNGISRRPNNLDFIKYISNQQVQKALVNGIEQNHLPMIEQMPVDKIDNYAFKNMGNLSFTNATQEWGLKKKSFSNGASYADLDNDGDLDLVINNINDEAFIYQNNSEKKHKNFLKVELKGEGKNTFGLGAKIIIKRKNNLYYQEQMPVRGFESSVDPILNFGVGNEAFVDSLIVVWTSGKAQVLTKVKANQRVILKEAEANGKYSFDPAQIHSDPLLRDITLTTRLNFLHKENKFNDFDKERLMPHLLSTQGPKMAVADLNHDGLDDIFIGGAKGKEGAVYIQDDQGKFTKAKVPALSSDSIYEDAEAVFFDADQDGDQDLFVASGGNEMEVEQNRLYINTSRKGSSEVNFKKIPFGSVRANASCVLALDFDKDQDFDLFIGSRSIPGQYGFSPSAYLLENDGKAGFTDVTKTKAPELNKIGMVTDAIFADLDNDQNLELVVVGEWMPVTVFEINSGQLKLSNQFKGFENTEGWWNCINFADFDKDGDLDLMAGNLGLNAIIKASKNEPAELWVKDFDGNGTPDPLITYFRQGKSYPVASKDELTMQIVSLKKKYVSYQSYAGQTLTDILNPSQLENVLHKKASLFASCYFENKGRKNFEVRPLPLEAQISPIFSLFIEDIDHNGTLDVLTGGNLYGVGPYYGKYDASYGLLLIGDGKGNLQPVSGRQSGFVVNGEVRDIQKVKSGGKNLYLISRNNKSIQVFK